MLEAVDDLYYFLVKLLFSYCCHPFLLAFFWAKVMGAGWVYLDFAIDVYFFFDIVVNFFVVGKDAGSDYGGGLDHDDGRCWNSLSSSANTIWRRT